jgi:hypothetical protein
VVVSGDVAALGGERGAYLAGTPLHGPPGASLCGVSVWSSPAIHAASRCSQPWGGRFGVRRAVSALSCRFVVVVALLA